MPVHFALFLAAEVGCDIENVVFAFFAGHEFFVAEGAAGVVGDVPAELHGELFVAVEDEELQLLEGLDVEAGVLLLDRLRHVEEPVKHADLLHGGASIVLRAAEYLVVDGVDVGVDVLQDEGGHLLNGDFHFVPSVLPNPTVDGFAGDIEDVGDLLLCFAGSEIEVVGLLLFVCHNDSDLTPPLPKGGGEAA